MSPEAALEMLQQAVTVTLTVAAPLLATAFFIGIVVSLIQAITQLHEQTLTFIPKLVTMAIVFVLIMPWMLGRLVGYLVGVINNLGTMTG